MRKLPIYFLIDVSESMVGEQIQFVEDGMATIIKAIKHDPHAIETVWVSIIVFAGQAKTLVPLQEIVSFYPPKFPIGGGTSTTLYLDGVKVGDAAQTTASIGASYEVLTRVFLDANYRFADNLYASIDPARFSSATNKGTLELPSYGLMDAGFSYKIFVDQKRGDSFSFRVNINNVLDEVYISESRTNIFADDNISSSNPSLGTWASAGRTYNGVANGNQVFFGYGRTWNFSVRYNF